MGSLNDCVFEVRVYSREKYYLGLSHALENSPFYSCVLVTVDLELELTLSYTNPPFIRKCNLQEKQEGLYQNKVNSNLTSTQRPGH